MPRVTVVDVLSLTFIVSIEPNALERLSPVLVTELLVVIIEFLWWSLWLSDGKVSPLIYVVPPGWWRSPWVNVGKGRYSPRERPELRLESLL